MTYGVMTSHWRTIWNQEDYQGKVVEIQLVIELNTLNTDTS